MLRHPGLDARRPVNHGGHAQSALPNGALVPAQTADGFRLNGSKVYVFDATSATHLLCAVRAEDNGHVGLVSVPTMAPGVKIRSLPGFAWNLAEVKLDNVAVDHSALIGLSFEAGWNALQQAISRTIPVLGAYQVGACQAVYEMSVDYSRTRIQFGTPIGRFQRVQDHIINLWNRPMGVPATAPGRATPQGSRSAANRRRKSCRRRRSLLYA